MEILKYMFYFLKCNFSSVVSTNKQWSSIHLHCIGVDISRDGYLKTPTIQNDLYC